MKFNSTSTEFKAGFIRTKGALANLHSNELYTLGSPLVSELFSVSYRNRLSFQRIPQINEKRYFLLENLAFLTLIR